MTRRHHWEDFEVEALKQMFPHFSAGEIAKAIGITEKAVHGKANALGLKKPIEWVAQRARERNQQPGHGGAAHRFTKGQQPWNAGTAGTGLMKGNSGSFKVGQMPHTWQPIGHTRTRSDGYLERKTANTGTTRHDYVGIHHLVWRMHGRSIPHGHALVFADGDNRNFDLNNLQLISRADLMRRNTVHRHGPEIAQLSQLLGAIKRQINRNAKKEADHA